MDSPQYVSLCVSLCGSWWWILQHTEDRDMNYLRHDTSCVSVYRSRIWHNCHTAGTDRMTLSMFFMLWLNSKQLSHRAQCYVSSLAWLFMCFVWWFLMLLLNILFTRNHIFLRSAFNRAKSCWILLASLCIFHPPGIILFSFVASLKWPGSCWVIPAWPSHPPVIIPFFARAPLTGPGLCYTLLTSLWLFHPSGIITFMSIAP